MTVGVGLKLSDNTLLLGADSRVTYGEGTTYDVAEKLVFPLKWGGIAAAGGLPDITDVIEKVDAYARERNPSSRDEFLNLVKQAYEEVSRNAIEDRHLRKYGLTYSEIVAGVREGGRIDDRILAQLREGLERPYDPRLGIFQCELLAGVAQKDSGANLYLIQYPRAHYNIKKPAVIGSGASVALTTMNSYLERLSRIERNNTPENTGLRIVVESLRASRRAVGVGGKFTVAKLSDGDHFEYEQDHLLVGERALQLKEQGLLGDEDIDEIFRNLTDGQSIGVSKEVVRKRVGDEKLADLFFSLV